MRIVLIGILALGIHLLLGWEWTLCAGIVAGAVTPRHGWFVGAAGTALAWASVLVYSFAVAPAATRVLLDTLSGFAGNIPGSALVALTVALGALVGGLGGAIGTLAQPLFGSLLPHVQA